MPSIKNLPIWRLAPLLPSWTSPTTLMVLMSKTDWLWLTPCPPLGGWSPSMMIWAYEERLGVHWIGVMPLGRSIHVTISTLKVGRRAGMVHHLLDLRLLAGQTLDIGLEVMERVIHGIQVSVMCNCLIRMGICKYQDK